MTPPVTSSRERAADSSAFHTHKLIKIAFELLVIPHYACYYQIISVSYTFPIALVAANFSAVLCRHRQFLVARPIASRYGTRKHRLAMMSIIIGFDDAGNSPRAATCWAFAPPGGHGIAFSELPRQHAGHSRLVSSSSATSPSIFEGWQLLYPPYARRRRRHSAALLLLISRAARAADISMLLPPWRFRTPRHHSCRT